MPFTLRQAGDTTNPRAPRPFGQQSTAGELAYYKREGGFTYLINLLGEGEKLFRGETNDGGFRGEGFFDSIVWHKYGGYMLKPYDLATGVGDWIFHKGFETDPILGFADPNQGRPFFFPELDFTFSGRPYLESRIPGEFPTGDGEPRDAQIRLLTSCLWDYDSDGNRVGSLPTYTANNARIIAFAARCAGVDIAQRIHWPSWVTSFRDKCLFGIPWEEGEGDGLTGEYFTTLDLTGASTTQIDRVIEFKYGESPALSRRWTGFVKLPDDGDYNFFTISDDGSRLWVDGVQLIDDWNLHGATERSGSITRTAGVYSITLEYFNHHGPAEISLLWSSNKISKQRIPQERLFSAQTIVDNGRIIPRFEGDSVYNGVPWPQVMDALMTRAPGVKHQITNGKCRFMWADDRTSVMTFVYETGIPFLVDTATNRLLISNHGLENSSRLTLSSNTELPAPFVALTGYYVINKTNDDFQLAATVGGAAIDITTLGRGTHTYTMRSNIVQASVVGQRVDPTRKPNFMVGSFRNKDEEVFKEGWVEVERQDLIDRALGKVNDPGTFPLGVARQSEAERVLEAQMRKLSDRDVEVSLQGQKGSHILAKHDLFKLIHPRGEWRLTPFAAYSGPLLMEVVSEGFESTIETANVKSFIGRIWKREYDDTAHGPLVNQPPGYVPSSFNAPPAVASVTLSRRLWQMPDGRYALAIDGLVQFDNTDYPFEQRGRLWWRKPESEIGITATHPTNTINAFGHNYLNGMPVMFRTDDTLPGGLSDTITYFVVLKTTNTFKVSLNVGGDPVDITSAGVGNHFVAPFVLTDTFLVPGDSRQAAFTLLGVQPGLHKVKVVSESRLQQKLTFEQHPTFTIDVAGLPPIADPTGIGFFDEVTGDLLQEISGTPQESASMEFYELEQRNDADTATIRPTIIIRPSANSQLQEYVIWNPDFDQVSVPPPDPETQATLLADGGADFTGGSGCIIKSQASAEIVGGLLIEWEVPGEGFITPTWMAIYPDDGDGFNFGDALFWQTVEITGPPYLGWKVVAEGFGTDTTPEQIQPIHAGDRLGIYTRPDGVAEYHINHTESSTPIYISGKPLDPSKLYQAFMRQNSGVVPPFGIPGVGVRKVSWLRQGGEFKYNAAAQRFDRGLAISDPLPAVVKWRIRQMSPYVNGNPSNWVNIVSTRP